MRAIQAFIMGWKPGRYDVYMPPDSRIMGVGFSRGHVMIWTEVDPDKPAPAEGHVFHVVDIGQAYEPLDEEAGTFMDYIGTFHACTEFKEFLGHVFEERAVPKAKEVPDETTG